MPNMSGLTVAPDRRSIVASTVTVPGAPPTAAAAWRVADPPPGLPAAPLLPALPDEPLPPVLPLPDPLEQAAPSAAQAKTTTSFLFALLTIRPFVKCQVRAIRPKMPARMPGIGTV